MLINTKTGRRYISIYSLRNKKFSTIRLDYIKEAALGDVYPEHESIYAEYHLRMTNSFSITHQSTEKLNYVKMLLSIDEATEQYMLERIKREGSENHVISQFKRDINTMASLYSETKID